MDQKEVFKHREWLTIKRREFQEARKMIKAIKEPQHKQKMLDTLEMFEEFADEFEKLIEEQS